MSKISLHHANIKRMNEVIILVIIMMIIGLLTIYFGANTYEVITGNDLAKINNITTYTISKDQDTSIKIKNQFAGSYDEGGFGKPAKIRFPESNKHIEVVSAIHTREFLARKGVAHTFVSANKRQKTFGEAIIYMRNNTSTIRHTGEFFHGDVINIVTDKGWQLGYTVRQVANDISELSRQSDKSMVVILLTDEHSRSTIALTAELLTVGERVSG